MFASVVCRQKINGLGAWLVGCKETLVFEEGVDGVEEVSFLCKPVVDGARQAAHVREVTRLGGVVEDGELAIGGVAVAGGRLERDGVGVETFGE